MKTLVGIALLRLEDLWEAWCESRHVSRTWITDSFSLNIEIIVKSGSREDLELLLHYAEGFDEGLQQSIANSLDDARKRIA
jgi:hypothetical protein